MDCPNCSSDYTLALAEENKGSACSQCGGVWISAETLTSLGKAHNYDPNILEIHLSEEKTLNESKACPSCRVSLMTSTIADIELDWCKSCNGVWFDRGEYDSVATDAYRMSTSDRFSAAFLLVEMLASIVR